MSTPIQIAQALITGTNQILYSSFSGAGVTTSMLASLDAQNMMTYDTNLDIWWEASNGTAVLYLAKSMTVPALSTASYRGLVTFNGNGQKLRASPSATGVHVLGTVMEQ